MTSSLEAEIRRRIESEGPMPFAAYMHLALYHPSHGFYADPARGPGADYRTAPGLSPSFGRLLARGLEEMWDLLGSPSPFTVIEVGAGRGDLALVVLEEARPPFRRALRWRIVERMPATRRLQTQTLGRQPAVEWVEDLGESSPVEGVVLANEVLDNFPVHLLEVGAGSVAEVYVDVREGRLVERLGPLSTDALVGHAGEALDHLEEGDRFEVCLAIPGWCRGAAAALTRGWILVIDYGDSRPGLWIRRPTGSIVTYRAESLGSDPLLDPGSRDITAHVDFTWVAECMRDAGGDPVVQMTQKEFLGRLGAAEETGRIREAQKHAEVAGDHQASVRLLADRSRLHILTATGGLGGLLVAVAPKNAPPYPPENG